MRNIFYIFLILLFPFCKESKIPISDDLQKDIYNPQCPDIKCPQCPDIKCPQCPDIKCPQCPETQCPLCPDIITYPELDSLKIEDEEIIEKEIEIFEEKVILEKQLNVIICGNNGLYDIGWIGWQCVSSVCKENELNDFFYLDKPLEITVILPDISIIKYIPKKIKYFLNNKMIIMDSPFFNVDCQAHWIMIYPEDLKDGPNILKIEVEVEGYKKFEKEFTVFNTTCKTNKSEICIEWDKAEEVKTAFDKIFSNDFYFAVNDEDDIYIIAKENDGVYREGFKEKKEVILPAPGYLFAEKDKKGNVHLFLGGESSSYYKGGEVKDWETIHWDPNKGAGASCDFKLDNYDIPHIVYAESYSGKIIHLWREKSVWKKEALTPPIFYGPYVKDCTSEWFDFGSALTFDMENNLFVVHSKYIYQFKIESSFDSSVKTNLLLVGKKNNKIKIYELLKSVFDESYWHFQCFIPEIVSDSKDNISIMIGNIFTMGINSPSVVYTKFDFPQDTYIESLIEGIPLEPDYKKPCISCFSTSFWSSSMAQTSCNILHVGAFEILWTKSGEEIKPIFSTPYIFTNSKGKWHFESLPLDGYLLSFSILKADIKDNLYFLFNYENLDDFGKGYPGSYLRLYKKKCKKYITP